jgi:hypothetical protein
LGSREIIYNPDMTGVGKVGITKIDGMLEKFSIANLPYPMRYLFLGKEAMLWQSLS